MPIDKNEIKNSLMFKIKIILLVIFLSFPTIFAKASNNRTDRSTDVNFKVSVYDSVQNTPLELVNLILKKGESVVGINITNPSGIAIFHDIQSGTYQLISHYIGYKDFVGKVNISQRNKSIVLKINEQAVGLNDVIVKSSISTNLSNYMDIKTGNPVFQEETYHAAPSSRMTTLIQENLIGAVRAPTGEVHIRGQHGEYTYYIDGIPIPLGVFGSLNEVIDPEVIKQITFFTGGFPAEYGGQIAAIMDIQSRVPTGRFHLSLSTYAGSFVTGKNLGNRVGLLTAVNSNGQRLSINNHIGKIAFFISGSRQETDRRIDQPVLNLFHDRGSDYFLYGKIDYLITNKDFLTMNLNYGITNTQIPYDPVEGVKKDKQKSFNSFQTLSYYHNFNSEIDRENNLFIGIYSRQGGLIYNSGLQDEPKQFLNNDTATGYVIDQNRNFITSGLRLKYFDKFSHEFSFTTGLNFASTIGKEIFTVKSLSANKPVNDSKFNGSDFGIFGQIMWHPLEWIKSEIGLRYDQHIAPDVQFQKQFSPRLKISFLITHSDNIYISFDRLFMPTSIEALSSVASVLGEYSSPTLAEKDNLYEAGYLHNFNNGLTCKFDMFHKNSSPGLDDETLGSSSIKVNVNINKVQVSGIELGLNYTQPTNPFSGYINTSLIHAYGTGPISGGFLPPNNSSTPFDLDHDQRLSLVIGLNYQPNNWFVNLVATYGTGLSNGNDSYIFNRGLFDFNQSAHTTPSWLVNISAGYKFYLVGGQSIETSIYITNLFDHIHLIKGAFFSGASFEAPRNMTFKISYNL